jgi:alanyl-tRNA synthetase
MQPNEIRQRYLDFFEKRGHAVVPSSLLVPENDPTTLFTGSGMQPLVPYLLGKEHPKGTRITDSQKCFRSGDIEEVGDNRHTTFFEMIGNWSLGDYFKKEQLRWFFEFLTDEIGLDPQRLYVTTFIGDEKNNVPRDVESAEIWKELFKEKGIEAQTADIGSEEDGYARGMKEGERIFFYDSKKNWWSRVGEPKNMPEGEPGGPDSEVFYDFGTEHDPAFGEHCHPNCDCGRFLEIGNSVFMQYLKKADGSFGLLPKQNVDFGGGLERIAMASQHSADIIASNHKPILEHLEKESGKIYGTDESETYAFRVIADHMKAAVFLIADGVYPGNVDQGYFVRRLIRRAVRYADQLGIEEGAFAQVVRPIAQMYKEQYPSVGEKATDIEKAIADEEAKFRKTLVKGLKEFEKLSQAQSNISARDAFVLFSTYGFPLELTLELANEKNMSVDQKGFAQEMKKHQELSRTASEGKFKGGLADASEQTTAYHTATHLLLAGLRKYLGDHVHQAGSNITAERLRFDFTHPEKVQRDVLDKIEAYVNEAIQKQCTVTTETMEKEVAKQAGVEGSFWEKYPDQVTVYSVTDSEGNVYSQELCGGPHVENTGNIQGTFKITKEEASSAGVRRIKAVLE